MCLRWSLVIGKLGLEIWDSEIFLVPKIYNLLNHTNRHKDKVASVNIEVGSFYFETLNANMHVMNKYTQTLNIL